VEQRFRAVVAVQSGARVVEVAARFGVSRQSVHAWLARYAEDGLEGLADRSHRPGSCPHQAEPVVEAAVCQLRRDHPRWGPKRIAFELGRDGCPGRVPSESTVYRILVRHGLVDGKRRRRRREDFIRWQRERPMELWQMDIVGGIMLADGSEAKVVTGVDDHSRFCVIAKVVPRQTGRAVCLAFAEGLARYGIPEEVLTDNGKQFTDRFGQGGEVLFDRICRSNGIVHRLTRPASPTTTGKVERFHQTLERELVDDHGPFADLSAAQAAVDAFVVEYNTRRPHQSLDMATPASRFHTPETVAMRESEKLIPLRLPGFLTGTGSDPDMATVAAGQVPAVPVPGPASDAPAAAEPPVRVSAAAVHQAVKAVRARDLPATTVGPVEFQRVVPPSGNLEVLGKQFWLGPVRSGQVVTLWADTHVIHLSTGGTRIKSVRSHLSVNDLAVLTRLGARPAGESPLPIDPDGPSEAVDIDRTVSTVGLISVGGHIVHAPERLAGTRIGVRVDPATLTLFDPNTRELVRVVAHPLSPDQILRLRGARPAGPPPQPRAEPVTVQRLASNTGTIRVCQQKIALGRAHARQVVTVHVGHDMLTIDLPDGPRTVQRTTNIPVFQVKAHRPRKVTKT
jgi:transposase InsO family protein